MLISENKLRRIIRQELIKEGMGGNLLLTASLILSAVTTACSGGEIQDYQTQKDLAACVTDMVHNVEKGKFGAAKLEQAYKIRANYQRAADAGGLPAQILTQACEMLNANPDR